MKTKTTKSIRPGKNLADLRKLLTEMLKAQKGIWVECSNTQIARAA